MWRYLRKLQEFGDFVIESGDLKQTQYSGDCVKKFVIFLTKSQKSGDFYYKITTWWLCEKSGDFLQNSKNLEAFWKIWRFLLRNPSNLEILWKICFFNITRIWWFFEKKSNDFLQYPNNLATSWKIWCFLRSAKNLVVSWKIWWFLTEHQKPCWFRKNIWFLQNPKNLINSFKIWVISYRIPRIWWFRKKSGDFLFTKLQEFGDCVEVWCFLTKAVSLKNLIFFTKSQESRDFATRFRDLRNLVNFLRDPKNPVIWWKTWWFFFKSPRLVIWWKTCWCFTDPRIWSFREKCGDFLGNSKNLVISWISIFP